ncbi:MAG: VOC family protein [Anaerolineales bacterium]
MARAKSYLPEGAQTLTPDLAINNGAAAKAIDFYKKAFGAREVSRAPSPDGKFIMHAHLQIGDSVLFLADNIPQPGAGTQPTSPPAGVVLNLFVEDADAVFERALKAGAETVMPLADMFWGDRYGHLRDPLGHVWAIATHKEDVSPEEAQRRSAEFFATTAR